MFNYSDRMELEVMKKIISLILVLVMCVALPISAAAAAQSPGVEPPVQTGDTNQLVIWFAVMAVSVVLLAVVVVLSRKIWFKK